MTPDEVRTDVLTRLAAQPNLQVFDGQPASGRPSFGYGAGTDDVVTDGDGRAHMYAALYVGSGIDNLTDERSHGLGGTRVTTFQVTAAGGDPRRCLLAAEKVRAALHGVRAGSGQGLYRIEVDPATPRTDDEPRPSRTYLPLIFRVALA